MFRGERRVSVGDLRKLFPGGGEMFLELAALALEPADLASPLRGLLADGVAG